MRSHSALASSLLTTLGLLLLALPGLCDAPPVRDLCFGNGTSGPFPLSWKHITLGTETVSINGLPQLRGLDYTLDADNGAVSFVRPLPARSVAAVSYQPDPAQARRNGDARTLPLSVDLMRGEHGYFSFNAIGKQGRDAGGDLTLGVGAGWSGGPNAQLLSHFFYTPVSAALGGKDAPADSAADSADKRLGVSLSGSARAAGWALFSFGFARAGVSLADAGDDSLRAGQQSFSLSSRLAPTRAVTAVVDFRQTSPTDGPQTGATNTTSVAVGVAPSDKTRVAATLAQTGTAAGGMTQTQGLSVDAHPTTKLEVSASYGGKYAPGTSADSSDLSLKTVLTPTKTVSLETSAGQSKHGAATTDQQSVVLTLSPHPAMQFGAGLALRQKATDGSPDSLDTAVASVSGALRPLSFMEFSASYKSRMAPAGDAATADLFDTSAAKVSLSPFKSVHLVGTYAQNPDDGGDTLQRLARKGVGLETTFGALGLSGGYDWSRRYDARDTEETIHADLGLRFSTATKLTVGFQTRQNALDPSLSQSVAYTVGFTHNLGDRFSLSLNGKRQQKAAAASDYNASANLGMKF